MAEIIHVFTESGVTEDKWKHDDVTDMKTTDGTW